LNYNVSMGRSASQWISRFAAFAALCGVSIYSALIPGHIVSQESLAIGSGQGFDSVMCHAGTDREATAPGDPSTPKKKCPFCDGYASFAAAALVHADSVVLPVETASAVPVTHEELGAHGVHPTPQNRGPPVSWPNCKDANPAGLIKAWQEIPAMARPDRSA
jgi:hypothetical protein